MNLKAFGLKNVFALKKGLSHALRRGEGERRDEGKLYVAWQWALPVLLGVTLGWFAMICLGVFLDGLRASAPGVFAPADFEAARGEGQTESLGAFLAANPFHVSPMPELVVPEKRSADVAPTGSLGKATLRGTLPGVGAWLEDRGRDTLVLVGMSFDVYTLEKVTGYRAVFVKSADRVVKELLFGAPSSLTVAPQGAASSAALPVGDVVPAAPDGKPGELPSGLVSQLVENPFEELKRVRLRPSEEGTGLLIDWIQEDSILSQLGVRKGDVVKSINGIPFRNMADIANSINSLMNSERFDVEVTRDGKPTALQYVVR